MSLTADIKTLLTNVSSNIYRNDRPDAPDNCITIYRTGGQPSIHAMGVRAPSLEKPTFQIEVRNVSFDDAIEQTEEIKDILNGLTKTTINTTLYEVIFLEGDTLNLGKDDRERSRLTINFVAWVNRVNYQFFIPFGSDLFITSDSETFKVKEV